MSSPFEEYDLRQEYRDILNEEIDLLKANSTLPRREKEKLDKLDRNSDIGVSTLLDPYFMTGNLKGAEEDKLKEKLLEKTRNNQF